MWWGRRPSSGRKKKLKACFIFWEDLRFQPYLWKTACSRPCLLYKTSLSFELCTLLGPTASILLGWDLPGTQIQVSVPCPPPLLSPLSLLFLILILYKAIATTALILLVSLGKYIWDIIFSWQDCGEWIFLNIKTLLYLNQVTKVNIIRNETYWYHVNSDIIGGEAHFISVVFNPKIRNSRLIMYKHQKNPNWGAFYRTSNRYSSKPSRLCKTRRDWETVTGYRRPRKHDDLMQHGSWIEPWNRNRAGY